MQQIIEVTELEPATELMGANSFGSKTYENWCLKEMARINNKLTAKGQRPDADVAYQIEDRDHFEQRMCQVIRVILEGE